MSLLDFNYISEEKIFNLEILENNNEKINKREAQLSRWPVT